VAENRSGTLVTEATKRLIHKAMPAPGGYFQQRQSPCPPPVHVPLSRNLRTSEACRVAASMAEQKLPSGFSTIAAQLALRSFQQRRVPFTRKPMGQSKGLTLALHGSARRPWLDPPQLGLALGLRVLSFWAPSLYGCRG
jgi:hypothetical protein